MSSLSFIVLSVLVCIFVVKADNDVCHDIGVLESKVVKTWDFTEGNMDFYFCYQSVVGATVNYCKLTLKEDGKEATNVTAVHYNRTTNEVGIDNYIAKMVDGNSGIYVDIVDNLEVVTYVTDVDLETKCMTYVDCFTDGRWGGNETEGAFIALVCLDKCDDAKTKPMVDKINDELLTGNPKLEKINQDECVNRGIK